MKPNRRGLSLIEAVVALVLLVTIGLGLQQVMQQDAEHIQLDRDALFASMALEEMKAAFGRRRFDTLDRILPAPGSSPAVSALFEDVLFHHPAVTPDPDSGVPVPPLQADYAGFLKGRNMQRRIRREALETGIFLVLFEVEYRDSLGRLRSQRDYEVVYDPRR